MKADRTVALLTLILCLAAVSGLRAQDPKGSELRINQTIAGKQWLPAVATAADGRFVVVWKEGTDGPHFVMARLFDAAGRPRSKDIRIARVAHFAIGRPAVSMAPDGRFVVVWAGGAQDEYIVFGRRFAADGRPLGPRFPLASTELDQYEPAVAMAPDGSFLAVWSQDDGDSVLGGGRVTDVMLRRFAADGRPLGPETVAIGGYDEQGGPEVAMRPNGDFVIAYESYAGEDGAFYGVLARRFSASGTPVGDEFLVNDGPTASEMSQYEPAVAMAPDGRFAVVWTDRGADYGRGLESGDDTAVAARFYAADGTPLGPSLFVNTFLPGNQEAPAVSTLQTGGFLVAWQSGAGQDGDSYGIFARVYGASGNPLGREFRLNLNRTKAQLWVALAVAPSGKGAAVWTSPDGDGGGIFARLLGIPRQGS